MIGLRRAGRPETPASARPLGGSILAGVPLTLRRPSLRGVALLVIAYSTVSTVLYVELVNQVGRRYASPGERTALFATIDLGVNVLALAVQVLGTGKLVQRFGLRTTLAVVPLLVTAGLGLLGAWRSLVQLATVQTIHRAGDYSLMRPGREMIFTTVDPQSRYKAKSFIDTAVYRANDAASAWLVAAVRGAGGDALMLIGIPAALVWLATGFRVGRRHDRHEPA
jgi:AAA family ATP:ADP antiporter